MKNQTSDAPIPFTLKKSLFIRDQAGLIDII